MVNPVEKTFIATEETQLVIKQNTELVKVVSESVDRKTDEILLRIPTGGVENVVSIGGIPHKAVYVDSLVVIETPYKINSIVEAIFLDNNELLSVQNNAIHKYSLTTGEGIYAFSYPSPMIHAVNIVKPSCVCLVNDLLVVLLYNSQSPNTRSMYFYRIKDGVQVKVLSFSMGRFGSIRCVNGHMFYNENDNKIVVLDVSQTSSSNTNTTVVKNLTLGRNFAIIDIFFINGHYYMVGHQDASICTIIKLDLQFNIVKDKIVEWTGTGSSVNCSCHYDGLDTITYLDASNQYDFSISGETLTKLPAIPSVFAYDAIKRIVYADIKTHISVLKWNAMVVFKPDTYEYNVLRIDQSVERKDLIPSYFRINESNGKTYILNQDVTGEVKLVKKLSHYEPI